MTVAMFSLVLLASGYVFLRLWQLSRSHLVRSEGHTLYFLVVWSAFVVGLLSITICHDIFLIPNAGPSIQKFLTESLRAYVVEDKGVDNIVRFGTAALMSMPLSFAFSWLLNIPLRASNRLCSSLLLRISSVTELECFLWEATNRSSPVMLTLSGGKVYVGNYIEAPSPGEERKWLRIEPLLSGYRDEKQNFVVTTSYLWIYEGATIDGQKKSASQLFDIFVPIEGIQSVRSFDIETFEKKFNSSPPTDAKTVAEQEKDTKLFSPRLRSPSERDVTPTEYIYFVYIGLLFSAPFLIFAGLTLPGLVVFLCALLLAKLYQSVRKAGKSSSDQNNSESEST